jgi:hypothetical protein
MKKLEEFKVHYPSLKSLASIQYTDPRVETEGRKIRVEREGQLFMDNQVYNGHYIVYNDAKLPGKSIAVHVSSDINEETGDAPIHVLAIDKNRANVVNRMKYRMRTSNKAIGELKELDEI